MRVLHRVALAAGAALAALTATAACGSATPKGAGSASPPVVGEAQILAVARRYAQCMREHGLPDYGDPRVRDGRLTGFSVPPEGPPDAEVERTADEACKHILADLPPSVTGQGGPSEAELANLVRFAQCIRAHGLPEWPDPKADGSFPIAGTALADKSNERFTAAFRECREFGLNGITIS